MREKRERERAEDAGRIPKSSSLLLLFSLLFSLSLSVLLEFSSVFYEAHLRSLIWAAPRREEREKRRRRMEKWAPQNESPSATPEKRKAGNSQIKSRERERRGRGGRGAVVGAFLSPPREKTLPPAPSFLIAPPIHDSRTTKREFTPPPPFLPN